MIKKIVLAFIIWRLFLFSVAYISPTIIPTFGNKFPYPNDLRQSNLPHFIWSWGNFDGVHYLRIANKFYDDQYTQTFFPLYPLLIKIFSILTFDNLIISALLISNAAFLAALILFYKLLIKNFSENVAFWSCLFLLTFPTSFYFGSIYTEGLFFLLLILSFYLYGKGQVLAASIAGSASSATRLVGIFLAPSLVKNYKIKSLIPVLIVPTGLISYMIYLKIAFNDPFYFLTAQSFFGQERSTQVLLLPQVFWRYFKILTTTSGSIFFNAALELASTLFAIVLLIFATKIVKRQWLIFSWAAVLVPTLTGTLTSMPRYILVAFPIYIVLAHVKNAFIKVMILIVFLTLLSICTLFFTQGYWVA